MIRTATLHDVAELVDMGERFLSSTTYANLVAHNPDQMRATAENLIGADDGTVLVNEDRGGALDAMIGLIMFPHHISGQRTVGEAFLWVDPQARGTVGVRLIRAAEAWAREVGAELMQLARPFQGGYIAERVGELYVGLGFLPIEVAHQKVLTA